MNARKRVVLLTRTGTARERTEAAIAVRRSVSDSGPRREAGAMTKARSVTSGRPLSSRKDTSASPTPSSVIAVAASNAGLARIVSAAVFTAFWSRGVKARSACCTRLPSWPATLSGMSIGFWVMK